MYRIGELAKACGVKADTLRFYEEERPHLAGHSQQIRLSPLRGAGQTAAGVHHPRQVGGLLPRGHRRAACPDTNKAKVTCQEVKAVADTKLEQVEQKLLELTRFSREPEGPLRHLLRRPALGGALRHPRDPGSGAPSRHEHHDHEH